MIKTLLILYKKTNKNDKNSRTFKLKNIKYKQTNSNY